MTNKQTKLQEIANEVKNHNCSLRSGCIQPVPGDGSAESDLVFIGEAPGKKEDELGKPFVGPAGKILQTLLEEIGLSREKVYITNVVKCRPPANRDPSPEEITEHQEFLTKELELIKPKLVILLGRHALNRFLPGEKISEARGKAKRKGEYIYFPIYHPAAALHNPNLLKDLRSDFMKLPVLIEKIKKEEELPKSSNSSKKKEQLTIF
ncbi:MAG: uracil-DNA glycosylase [Patescibacteria group bacterium]|nr:uracil-DNA glycosylase [Patescibacteria group bacterium]